jgi:hypothetical protein
MGLATETTVLAMVWKSSYFIVTPSWRSNPSMPGIVTGLRSRRQCTLGLHPFVHMRSCVPAQVACGLARFARHPCELGARCTELARAQCSVPLRLEEGRGDGQAGKSSEKAQAAGSGCIAIVPIRH